MDFIGDSSDLTEPTGQYHTSQMQQAVGALAIIVDASAEESACWRAGLEIAPQATLIVNKLSLLL